MGRLSKREHILKVARNLFYDEGVRAVGVDRIVAESGVAKMTLYSHFGSKDELVVECLQSVDERYRAWLKGEVNAASTGDPVEDILSIFDALFEWFNKPKFHGCAFVNAVVEVGSTNASVRTATLNHKHRMREWITSLAAIAGLSEPEVVGAKILLLMEGAIITALVDNEASSAKIARQLAFDVVCAHSVRQPV
ncbi:TetR/AcrR family transcriptional regulator [Arthrobacter oryzae]|uniref:TetR/AcrR family transcriptional regulator n=1 Tax=Arthrobacter oryzae TaxID=409290 RepID=A0A3N0BXC1_9MICC|nr:TetR/AcrR family transcriptional regulator [Arthrobacter oryzae]RNL54337.1 TetR/AcrR family transcriptional regulator [Arthrobacter oryzae]